MDTPPLLHLPGSAFTIWTRPQARPTLPPAAAATSVNRISWPLRCAWGAVGCLAALWYSDHQSLAAQRELLQAQTTEETALKAQFHDQTTTLQQSLDRHRAEQQTLTGQLADLQAQLVTAKETHTKAQAAAAQQQAELAQLKATQAKALAALQTGLAAKDAAWKQQLTETETAANQARQGLEQRVLELQAVIAKAENAAAAATKDTAAANLRATTATAALEEMQRKQGTPKP